jgi:cobalt/nickel transport protein
MKRFALGFGLVILLVAGWLSYLADSDPDGLDAVTERGCTSTDGGLVGTCIAQDAAEHPLGGTPLADYTVGSDGRLTGIAGALGSVVVLLLALGLFRLLRLRRGQPVHDQ